MLDWIVLFVFWYPACMSTLWMIGGILFYFRVERKKPLPLTETPMVSLLVPCCNEGETIRNTVKRLDELDYPNYEIIAIDDGSEDNTYEVLQHLSLEYERLRVVHMEKNAGKANALYHGLLAASGEIIVGVDADSYLAKDALLYMVPHFTNKNNGERVGAVTGNPRVRNRSSLLAKIQLCEYASIISLIKRTQRMLGKVMTVSGVVVAYRKRALLDCHLWDRDMVTEDVAVTWKLEKNFWDVRYEPRALCWMLVPETVKGIWKQRQRWTRGGMEVMGRHVNIFKSWKERRLVPVFLEQCLSIVWSFCWLYLAILEVIRWTKGDYINELYWKSQFLSFVCIVQFAVAMILDKRYDKKLLKNSLWAVWYPLLYWYINALEVIVALPKTILRKRKKLATWTSPDRGIDTTEKEEHHGKQIEFPEGFKLVHVPAVDHASIKANAAESLGVVYDGSEKGGPISANDSTVNIVASLTPSVTSPKMANGAETQNSTVVEQEQTILRELPDVPVSAKELEKEVIDGKQKLWKKVIEVVFTVLGWAYMISYVIYFIYGAIAERFGFRPIDIWIYNESMVAETRLMFFFLFIVILVNIVVLYLWKTYNLHHFGHRRRRRFPAHVSDKEIAEFFETDESKVRIYREAKIVEFEENVI